MWGFLIGLRVSAMALGAVVGGPDAHTPSTLGESLTLNPKPLNPKPCLGGLRFSISVERG